MKGYNIINRCLGMLRYSRIDVMTKLRMENLLIGIKMLLLADVVEQERMPALEELFSQVKEVCSGDSPDGVKGLVEHVRKMQSSIVASLNLSC